MHAHTLPNRGKTFLTGSPDRTIDATMKVDLEGSIKHFDDVDPTVTSGAKMRRSNKRVVCMLVRNEAAAAVLPKRVVSWKSGQRNKQIDGYCKVTDEACAGVVDEFLTSAGAAVHDLFWIVVQGPTLMMTSLAGNAENVINLDDLLGALTAVTSGATTSGRVAVQALTGATAVLGNQIVNGFGRALSAKTTANTNADILVDTYFLKS
jgi:hypothetical protein